MIHFKVIRASRLLLALAIILLIALLTVLGVRLLKQRDAPPVNSTASLVEQSADDEARTAQVFASSGLFAAPHEPQDAGIEIEILERDQPKAIVPRILIYHTHTHEAYEQDVADPYEALEAWRTTDAGHSVVRVGEALASRLRHFGFDVVHDTTDHEGNQLSTAYTRSLATLTEYRERFDLYIDLHRDAYVEGDPVVVKTDSGEEMAPLMLLIGNGNGFDVKPWYAQNLRFAQALEARINRQAAGLCKPVLVKDGRYNQHIGLFSILVEVGHNRNTLVQACNSVAPLAHAIYSLMVESPEPELESMKSEWLQDHPDTRDDTASQAADVAAGQASINTM